MKAFVTIFVLIASIQAQAATPKRFTETLLNVVSISDNSPLAEERIESGFLSIDHFEDTAKLVLNRAMPECPQGLYCTLAMPAPLVIEFENVTSNTTFCGSIVYKAIIDASDIDGLVETLIVADNTFNHCLGGALLEQYEVSYSTYAPRSQIKSFANFVGPILEKKVTLPVQPLPAM